MNQLICTMGLPRSGKTTWAKEQGCPIVNPDALRLVIYGQRYWAGGEYLVWPNAMMMVKALFAAGHDRVIVDATNTTRKRRDFWIHEDWSTSFKIIDTLSEICVSRAKAEKDDAIIPIIEKMLFQWESLTNDEYEFVQSKG